MLDNDFQVESDNNIFVETGLFWGNGVISALNRGYKKVISIEISKEHYEHGLSKFSKEIHNGIVELYYGDSSSVLADVVLKYPNDNITFWFDAHDQSMEGAGCGELKCPIVKELNTIIYH